MTLLQTAFETHDGHRLRCARLGSGPPLVLLHGYPDNLQIFSALVPLLAPAFTVIAFDWPGLGRSEEWIGGTTPFHMAERLRALLDGWGLERADVLGLDMGGQPALALAAEHPERVRRLIVTNSLVMPEETTSWEIRVLRRYRWNERIIRLLPRLVFLRAEHTFLPAGNRLPREIRDDLWQSFRQPRVRRFVSRMCGGYQGALPRLASLYAGIRVPTVVLWGEHDRHFPPVHAERLHATIPGSQLRIVAGGEHWMVWHAAVQVAEAVLAG